MKYTQSRKLVTLSLLVAAGILMQLMEAMVPVVMIIPGYKIGLANITGLYALYVFGTREMWIVTLLRILLSALCTGSLFSVAFILSICGGLLSLCAMTLAKKSGWFSIFGTSVAGAAAHCLGQVLAVSWIYQQYFMQLFLPVLIALSIVSGLLIAWLTRTLIARVDPARLKHCG